MSRARANSPTPALSEAPFLGVPPARRPPRDRLLREIRSDENTRGVPPNSPPAGDCAPTPLLEDYAPHAKRIPTDRSGFPSASGPLRGPPDGRRPMIPDGPDSAPYVPVPMVSPAAGIYSNSQSEPSLRSLTRIPAAASPSRMRSEAAQSFAARALRRSSSSISTRGVM